MMQTVQLSIADGAIRRRRSGSPVPQLRLACRIGRVVPTRRSIASWCWIEAAFARLPLPLSNPERVVLITRKDPQLLAEAWDAGDRLRGVSEQDPISTVLLAIMAAALRVVNITASLYQAEFPPIAADRHCATSPTKSDIQDPNVVKSNSLARCRLWTSACTTVHSGKEASRWNALSQN